MRRETRHVCARIGTVLLTVVITAGTPTVRPLHAQSRTSPTGVPQVATLALADSLAGAGDTAGARRAYRAVLHADAAATAALYNLARLSRRGSAEQLALLARYTALEPDDAWGHLAHGDALYRAGRTRSALRAYERGLALEPEDEDLGAGARRTRVMLRPVVEPLVAGSTDSDDNRVLTAGGALLLAGPADTRVSLRVSHDDVRDAAAFAAAATTVHAGVAPAISSTLRANAAAGVTRYDSSDGQRIAPTGSLLLRVSGDQLAQVEVRAGRGVVTATPLLVRNGVVLTEGRVRGTVPLAGMIGLRGMARVGRIDSDVDEANTRTGWGGGLVAAVSPLLELSLNGQRLGYARNSEAGYFAPRRAEVAELGLYTEHYPGSLELALDAGAGAQRVLRFDDAPASWKPALRAWASLSTSSVPRTRLGLEVEAERSQLDAPAGGTGEWQYANVRVIVRQRL